MGRERRTAPGVGTGETAKERHKRDRRGNVMDWNAPLPPGLVARPEKPRISSGHKSWFEFIENKDKKKKLEFEFTEKKEPPPGFEFVPIGNPALTTACKELSREQDAMIFIVTTTTGGFSKRLSAHLNRMGHHIRQSIVEQARATLGDEQLGANGVAAGLPEPVPEKQEDINKQADAAIRDLFPRIPNTDRQMIIEHAFNKSNPGGKDGPPVGLASHITLSRRVQLAVLAHIRHTHTRYDQLLKETTYVNARKTVESLCLDILVKWRGDEETGRDQLDEILCEVIVISDSESDESDEDDDGDDSSSTSSAGESPVDRMTREDGVSRATGSSVDLVPAQVAANNSRREPLRRGTHAPQKITKASRKDRKEAKWPQRGFNRYQAARDQAWHQAVERQRHGNDGQLQSSGPAAMDRSASKGPQVWRTAKPSRAEPEHVAAAHNLINPPNRAHNFYGAPIPPTDLARERGRRVVEPQPAISTVAYPMQQQPRAQEHPFNIGSNPMVESRSRTVPSKAPEIKRVSYHGEDLKDYLVQSIEPPSPQPSNFPSRFPAPYREPEHVPHYGPESPMRAAGRSRDPLGPPVGIPATQGSHPAYAEEGFIRLPPRSDPNRMLLSRDQRPEPFVLLNPLPVSAAGGTSAIANSGFGFRQSSTWQDDAVARNRGAGQRSEARPLWIGHDGVVLRSESRPIVIQDYPSPPRQSRMDPGHMSLERHRVSPSRWTDARQADPSWVSERDKRPVDSRMEQRIETLQDDFVEIVRVSNKFPRQHEARPAPGGTERYNPHSTAPPQVLAQQPNDAASRYDARRVPAPGQRLERVVGRVEVPPFHDENMPFVARPADGYPRHERVVGIEYVHPRPSLETRTYSDRGPFHDSKDPVYRSRSNSAVPVAYPGLPYQSYPGRPTPKRDEVMLVD